MKISEKQILALFIIVRDSCNLHGNGCFSFSTKSRIGLIEDIINQQEGKLVDIKEKDGD